LGEFIIPEIIHLVQLTSIYIYCQNIVKYEQLANNYPNTIRGVFANKIEMLSKIITDFSLLVKQELPPFSLFNLSVENSTFDLSAENAEFIWF
jgi:hypothetical protein